MEPSQLSLDERRAYWHGHWSRWCRSGQSQAGYCRRQGLNKHRFRYWKQRFEASEDAAAVSGADGFMPVQLVASSVAASSVAAGIVNSQLTNGVDSGITVRLPTGLGLELRCGFDREALRAVVQALSG